MERPRVYRLLIVGGLLLAIFLPRLLSLGTILTVDEPLWQGRGAQFMKGLATGHFEKTLTGGQPGVTTTWLAGLVAFYGSLTLSQAMIAVACGGLLVLNGYFLVRLWGGYGGSIALLLLALNPFLIAHSRIVHTDALLALSYLGSLTALLAGLQPLRQSQVVIRRYLIVSAWLAGVALLTKILALVVVPTALLIIGITGYIAALPRQQIVRLMFLWVALFVITMYVFWPVLWFNADQAWGLLSERASLHSEGTREEETTSRSWYYLRELAFRLTVPSTILIPVGLVGLALARPAVARWSTTWLMLAGLVYLAAISYGSDKSDRYGLFTLLAFDVVAAYGLWFIATYRAGRFRRYAAGLLLLTVSWLSLDAIRLHPYYLAHYNRLYPIEADHKLGWGEGLEQAAAWITEQSPDAKVFSYYQRVFDHWYPGTVETLSHFDEGSADYAVLYRSMFERGPGAFETDLVESFVNNPSRQPVHTVVINGLPYAWIYKLGED